jgi:hypothetical protein
MRPAAKRIAAAQAAFYLPTAVAPFVSRRRFEAVTGPKRDWWLVITVSSLIGSIGAALAVGSRQPDAGPELAMLGGASAVGLAAVDIVYVARRQISAVYLLDAAVELGFAGVWLAAGRP